MRAHIHCPTFISVLLRDLRDLRDFVVRSRKGGYRWYRVRLQRWLPPPRNPPPPPPEFDCPCPALPRTCGRAALRSTLRPGSMDGRSMLRPALAAAGRSMRAAGGEKFRRGIARCGCEGALSIGTPATGGMRCGERICGAGLPCCASARERSKFVRPFAHARGTASLFCRRSNTRSRGGNDPFSARPRSAPLPPNEGG